MNTEKLTELIGDLTIFDLNIDFKNKSIIMNLGYLPFGKIQLRKLLLMMLFGKISLILIEKTFKT